MSATHSDPIVIVGAARTPMGALQGDFSSLAAHDLGGAAIRAAVARAGVAPDAVGEVLLGNCLMAGQGQAPARQAAFKGGLPQATGAVTLSKMCGSGMKAAMLAHDMLLAGTHEVMVAGGMESMSRAPYLLQKGRGGYRLGHDRVFDHLMLDGLEDAYQAGRSMGSFGEDCAAKYQFSRAQQDAFATASVQRARAATESGAFAAEIVPVAVEGRSGETLVSIDEGPGKVRIEKITTLKPAFKKDGSITAASSSSINDGAAALVLMRASGAQKFGCKPLARIAGHATHAQAPEWFTTAPLGATRKALAKAGWSAHAVQLWEINEAFAVVPMALMKELDLPHDRVNVNGGACALGHPIGASGARILVTLIHALAARGLSRGLATLCIGGGEATAVALEML
ncbi:acetyl-CoA C-acyltransferase [Verminephrobacter aporrectodeae subsp. tuberculatae]|uniref:acetyl-CoA C-acyltransferase n=1 Tax=Verminephrobacter aporrectodeae TaxID=1110389 RepID=UPI00023756D0|nr:acetyl-CoA C-acyltransferase [Verminephrobacter aporrectodeae]MCW5222979.1 acetyl-CoA C-acyltransferase [Verminephrobacter aporrectodeae subsp. tuberculatae]MCW5288443.1 acetyl-CoA C-acyltransferase [Verminephrobacter aporrectodeae subsp. tuberculatae]MCW8164386.1 acetyl-CoA C-acyltransferase [Verminephrobacter aporrectodeae subsp. tuberculatae]MCW8170335.1 acetyl-CoA C-acyltransferase [Verminephrobacter aporrectodeae subsp. tuberculatae]MCW8200103.1 acetyl-CoA C-acyltransferase [Verminephr